MILYQKQIRVSKALPYSLFRFFYFCLLTSFISFNLLEGKIRFPARGFAKILTIKEASLRLSSYRSFLGRDLNKTTFHEAYAFRFRLRHMPRRGDEFSRTGTIYGLSLGHGLSRIDLDSISTETHSKRFLLHNGPKPKAWVFLSNKLTSKLLQEDELFQPLIDGMNQSPFDLLMPFVFWNSQYEKSGRVAGRPSHLYSFSSPQWVQNTRPEIKKIVMALDENYEAPLRIETFARSNVPDRTFILNSLKKVSDHWIVKSIDCKDRKTRSNTRFEVISAAINLDLDFSLFSPEGLLNKPLVPEDSFLSTR